MQPKRIDIIGVPVDCLTMEQALEWVDAMAGWGGPRMVIAVNPEKVMRARKDPALLGVIQRAGLLIPDGIGIVFAARLLRLGVMERVPGSELMPAICERAARDGHKIFLFGATPEVNQRAATVLRDRFPGIRIVGTRHGYVTERGMAAVLQQINDSQADVLFVALGSPAQELWMDRYLPRLRVKICQGVGGTFDVLSGKVKRAPPLFRTMHLEWFYRLVLNPARLLRQSALPLFALQVLRKRVAG